MIIPNAFGISNNHAMVSGVPGIDVQSYPVDVAINSETDKIYVANYLSNTISIIDGKTNTVNANITIGANPIKVVVSPFFNRISSIGIPYFPNSPLRSEYHFNPELEFIKQAISYPIIIIHDYIVDICRR